MAGALRSFFAIMECLPIAAAVLCVAIMLGIVKLCLWVMDREGRQVHG